MLVNATAMLQSAEKGHYGIGAFNTNNLEWASSILDAAEELQSPVIIQCTSGAAKWQTSFKIVSQMVHQLVEDKNITVPVALHLDHGTYEDALKCIEAGFTSVMYDGSHEADFETNLARTAEIVKIAHNKGISVEAEVGGIGGVEDGVASNGELADPEQCKAIAAETGAAISFEEDPAKAAKGADVLYTDVWVSMGEPAELWAERIKSFKDSFIPVFGDACKDAACRFGFSKDGSNTFKSAVDAFAANICDLYGAAPQIVDGFCEFLARNACLEFDGYAADMPVPCQLYVAEGISKMAYQQAMNSVRGFKLDTDASVEFAEKFINDNVTTPDSFMHLNDACVAIENVMAAPSPAAVLETAAVAAPVAEVDDAPVPAVTVETDAEFEDAVAQAFAAEAQAESHASPAPAVDAGTTGILPTVDAGYPVEPGEAAADSDRSGTYQQDAYQGGYQGEGAGYAREQGDYTRPETYGGDIRGQYGSYDRDVYGSTYKQGY